MKSLVNRIRNCELTIGSWITMGNTSVAEIMSQAGFDWLTVDMEHSAITLHQAQQLIQVIELAGPVPLVRVGENSPSLIKRVMDAGAHGVIVPMVNSKEDSEAAVAAVKYPPVGKRGVGLARAQRYGFGFESYKEWETNESIIIAQIEHIHAIENLEDILITSGITGTIIGPYDLSASMGWPGEFKKKEVMEAIAQYEKTCRKMRKPMGFHVVQPDLESALQYQTNGYSFLAIGLDTLYLGSGCRGIVAGLSDKE